MVSTDFKIHLFNDYLNYLGWFPLRTRLVSFMEFQEDKSRFITAGIDGCYVYSFVSKSKYEPKQAIMLDPEGEAFDCEIVLKQSLESMPLWIKGLKIMKANECIFSWSQMKATFHDMNGKLIFKYKNLTKYEDHITDVLLNMKYKYFITSTQQGNLFVWKYQKEKELVHQFDGHLKAVTSLQNVKGQSSAFISASIDNSIRIHSLDNFQELYCFKLTAGVTHVKLIDHQRFACVYNHGTVRLGELQNRARLFHQSQNEVVKIMKCFRSEDEKYANHADLVMIQYKDNSINIQTSDLEESKLISIIYPPPTAKDIKFFYYCMNLDRVYLMLVTGTICVYKFDRHKVQEPAQLQQLMETKNIKDSMRRSLNQEVTTMSFCKTIPPMIDEETINRAIVTPQKINEEIEYQQTKWNEGLIDRFIVLGMSTGSVVFLQVDQMDLIYARISIHREAITQICEIAQKEIFVSICEAMQICVWDFKKQKLNYIS